MEKHPLKLIPPSDPRVVSAIAPFNDEMLKEYGYKDRQELSDDLFETMKKAEKEMDKVKRYQNAKKKK